MHISFSRSLSAYLTIAFKNKSKRNLWFPPLFAMPNLLLCIKIVCHTSTYFLCLLFPLPTFVVTHQLLTRRSLPDYYVKQYLMQISCFFFSSFFLLLESKSVTTYSKLMFTSLMWFSSLCYMRPQFCLISTIVRISKLCHRINSREFIVKQT